MKKLLILSLLSLMLFAAPGIDNEKEYPDPDRIGTTL